MKTKKISWQAIAIVVLALVLIASIALGVSGAWFQDRDNVDSQAKFADSVTVRLKDPSTSKDPVSWEQYYKKDLAGALPGDYVIGQTTVYLGSTTPTLLRYNVSAEVYTDDTKTKKVTEEWINGAEGVTTISESYKNGELNYFVPATGTEGAKWVEATSIEEKWKAEALVSLNALKTELGKGVVLSENWGAKEDGKNFGYFTKIVNAEAATNMGADTIAVTVADGIKMLESGVNIPTTVNNAAEKWTIEIKVEVEAIQAANLVSIDGTTINNEDWMNDMPTALQALVKKYNAARKAV